jgi:hypothetical protein
VAHAATTLTSTVEPTSPERRVVFDLNDCFEEAIATWAHSYADQIERDYAELQRAVRKGRLPAEAGV